MRKRHLFLILSLLWLCAGAQAATYTPQGDLIGEAKHYTVAKKETLYDIARRFDLGIGELRAANPGINPWKPKPGTELVIPGGHLLPDVREGIVLNLAELRLYYFTDEQVMTFPVGVGREGWVTPTGSTTVVMKRKNPVWFPPASIRAEKPDLPTSVPAGPNSPLGLFALNLGWINYAIHGTNQPSSIGKRSSHGCVRMYPEDIDALYHAVSVGTKVTVIDAAYKLGWQGNMLYLEIPPAHRMEAESLHEAVSVFAGDGVEIDWQAVDDVAAHRHGIPTAVGKKHPLKQLLHRLF